MPETSTFGFEYETPQSKPGITLTGDISGDAPILAEQVDTALATVDARVAANESTVAGLQNAVPSDTGWLSMALSEGSGFDTIDSEYRRWGPVVGIIIHLTRTGSDIDAGANGSVPDTTIATISDSALRPDRALRTIGRCSGTSGAVDLETSGNVQLVDLHANSSLLTDDTIRITTTYFVSTFS